MRRADGEPPGLEDGLAPLALHADRAAVDADERELELRNHLLHSWLLPAIAPAWPFEANASTLRQDGLREPGEGDDELHGQDPRLHEGGDLDRAVLPDVQPLP
eukprot:4057867-Heterocapsa_arctica.AAC.1